jgi:hypothetical protein
MAPLTYSRIGKTALISVTETPQEKLLTTLVGGPSWSPNKAWHRYRSCPGGSLTNTWQPLPALWLSPANRDGHQLTGQVSDTYDSWGFCYYFMPEMHLSRSCSACRCRAGRTPPGSLHLITLVTVAETSEDPRRSAWVFTLEPC